MKAGGGQGTAVPDLRNTVSLKDDSLKHCVKTFPGRYENYSWGIQHPLPTFFPIPCPTDNYIPVYYVMLSEMFLFHYGSQCIPDLFWGLCDEHCECVVYYS